MPNNIALDFDYEFRHPGHGDQSVHNPHKGGGVPAGFVRPTATDPYFRDKPYDISDEDFVTIARSNGLDPQTLSPDKFTAKDRLAPAEYEAVVEYQDGTNRLQGALTGDRNARPEDVATAKTLRRVVESRSLEDDATLHRGMGNNMLDRLQQAGEGGVVKTDKFVSTAAHRNGIANFGNAVLEIEAPKGTKGAWLDRLTMANDPGRAATRSRRAKEMGSPFQGESEFVLAPGTKFRIKSIGTTQRRVFGTKDQYKTVPFVKVTIEP